jgi:hypothetical protein
MTSWCYANGARGADRGLFFLCSANRTLIPIHCTVNAPLSDFDGSWTVSFRLFPLPLLSLGVPGDPFDVVADIPSDGFAIVF